MDPPIAQNLGIIKR